jgi:Protein inscuteable C-terminal
MHANDTSRSSCRSCKIKRSRVITKNSRPKMSNSLNESSDNNNNSEIEHKNYNNETVYFGYGDCSIMEEKSLLMSSPHTTPLKLKIQPYGTSTPKLEKCNGILQSLTELLPQPSVYKNVLLNGNFASVQSWIDNLRFSFSSEIMSTLQSKNIETDSIILTPSYAFKLIKNLQEKAFMMQQEFDKVEKCDRKDDFLSLVQHLSDILLEFVAKQELRKVYYTQNVKQYRKLCENLGNMREMSRDLKNICSKIDIDDLDEFPICDDLMLIKRYFLLTVKILFKILVSSLVEDIEHAKNEIMLRSNITHIANLISMEEYGETTFSSLNDAFVSCSVVRVLLLVCLENKSSWMRALSLRTLSLVCTSEETIQQFEINSGFEIIRDIIMDKNQKRLEQEVRESISLLASITAPWQSSPDHHFKELKDYCEDYIEGITGILNNTKSCQTILICVAVLNNLSRLESSSTYSLISNQTLLTLMHVFAQQINGEYTIFFAVSFFFN